MNITRVGVDIAKSVFHVHGVDRHDQIQWQAKLKRNQWIDVLCEHVAPGAEIGMEACASAHYWGRELQKRGYTVKLIAAQFVKPYVKSNKNDLVDAEAVCEAMGRPRMRFVAVKTIEQQDIQAAHRIREELVAQRTAKANQIRGLVGEYGIIAPVGIQKLRSALPRWLEDAENGLTDEFRALLTDLADDLRHLTCTPTTPSRRPRLGWTVTSGSTMAAGPTAVLTGKHQTSFTSKRCPYPWQLKPRAGIHL